MNNSYTNELLKIEVLGKDFINKITDAGISMNNFISLLSTLAATALDINNQITFDKFDKEFKSLCEKYDNNKCTCAKCTKTFNKEEK